MLDLWIDGGGLLNCPGHSPGRTLLDYFRCFPSKYLFFNTQCTSLTQLKCPIVSTFQNIRTNMPQNVWQNLQVCFSAERQENGGQVENIM